jgi:hypothetical protein
MSKQPKRQQVDELSRLSQGSCHPTTRQSASIKGVWDDLVVPANLNDLSFNVIVLGKVVVRGQGTSGVVYRPLVPGQNDYAELALGNAGLRVVRKPRSELLELTKLWAR